MKASTHILRIQVCRDERWNIKLEYKIIKQYTGVWLRSDSFFEFLQHTLYNISGKGVDRELLPFSFWED
jgi:hypothetical protein